MIRIYEEKEIPLLVNIWEAAALLAHPFLSEVFHNKVKKDMYDMYLPNSDTWVYETSGEVLGFLSMYNNEIGGLFVLPTHHSKGIGTALVNHVQTLHDILEVEVFENNKIGKPFYKKLGFRLIKAYFHEESKQKILRLKK